jgi:hypothetical protein
LPDTGVASTPGRSRARQNAYKVALVRGGIVEEQFARVAAAIGSSR